MKVYGESVFDLLYLAFAIALGVAILRRAVSRRDSLMGVACIVLGGGDAFHLIPRVLNYFIEVDFSAALGIGKLVTSITMTAFYLLLYRILLLSGEEEKKPVTITLYILSAFRVALCLFPQNEWITNSSPLLWGILRNIPFLFIGAIVAYLYYKARYIRNFRFIWLCIIFSFAFYIAVVVGAEAVPTLGMLMLPKTVCYVLILFSFWCEVNSPKSKDSNAE